MLCEVSIKFVLLSHHGMQLAWILLKPDSRVFILQQLKNGRGNGAGELYVSYLRVGIFRECQVSNSGNVRVGKWGIGISGNMKQLNGEKFYGKKIYNMC